MIVGYDIVFPTHEEVGDCESGPMLKESWDSIFGRYIAPNSHHIETVIEGEEIRVEGFDSSKEAIRVMADLMVKYPDEDFQMIQITKEDLEISYWHGCFQQEIQV